jgi:hypothetical protein
MPEAKRLHGAAVVDGLIYATGGFAGGNLASVHRYDLPMLHYLFRKD